MHARRIYAFVHTFICEIFYSTVSAKKEIILVVATKCISCDLYAVIILIISYHNIYHCCKAIHVFE